MDDTEVYSEQAYPADPVDSPVYESETVEDVVDEMIHETIASQDPEQIIDKATTASLFDSILSGVGLPGGNTLALCAAALIVLVLVFFLYKLINRISNRDKARQQKKKLKLQRESSKENKKKNIEERRKKRRRKYACQKERRVDQSLVPCLRFVCNSFVDTDLTYRARSVVQTEHLVTEVLSGTLGSSRVVV